MEDASEPAEVLVLSKDRPILSADSLTRSKLAFADSSILRKVFTVFLPAPPTDANFEDTLSIILKITDKFVAMLYPPLKYFIVIK